MPTNSLRGACEALLPLAELLVDTAEDRGIRYDTTAMRETIAAARLALSAPSPSSAERAGLVAELREWSEWVRVGRKDVYRKDGRDLSVALDDAATVLSRSPASDAGWVRVESLRALADRMERWVTPGEIAGEQFAQARMSGFQDAARMLRDAIPPPPANGGRA